MRTVTLFIVAFLVVLTDPAAADWVADPDDKVQVRAIKSVEAFRERVPRTERFFDEAYGYAIFPSITRVGFGFGGAYGKGIVVSGGDVVGRTKYWQFTSGIQAGAKAFSLIIFFRDAEALASFQTGQAQFMGQAGLALGTFGVAGTPGYNDGVAVVTMTRFGLMGEFTISGVKFGYKPLVAE